MADLPDELKALIVVRLATFVRPAEIIKELAQDHKQKVSRQQLTIYDPGTHTGRALSAELKKLFDATRKRYHEDLTDLALGSAAGRARFLTAIAQAAMEKGQAGRAMEAVELIAKDMGGQFIKDPASRAARGGQGDAPSPSGAEADADADGGAADRAARTASLFNEARARRDLSPAVAAGDGDAAA